MKDAFNAAANSFKESDFEEHMQNLKKDAPAIYEKVMGIGPVRWAISKCPVRRYEFLTSNAVESLNGRLKWARELPVTALLEYARNLLQSWFYQRRTKVAERISEVTDYAENRLAFSTEKAKTMIVQPISDTKFNILLGGQSNIVDLRNRECSCKVFQSLLLPCSHAIAAIRFVILKYIVVRKFIDVIRNNIFLTKYMCFLTLVKSMITIKRD